MLMKRNIFMSALMAVVIPLMAQQSGVDTTFVATSNPFVKYKYLGDPAALVDRLYYKKNGELKRIQMTSEGIW